MTTTTVAGDAVPADAVNKPRGEATAGTTPPARLSPHQAACYATRLIDSQGMTPAQVAALLGTSRELVNALLVLPTAFARIPRAWQRDLRHIPGRDTNHTPVVTVSYWRAVAGAVRDSGVSPALRKLMVAVHKKSWPVRTLEARMAKWGGGRKAMLSAGVNAGLLTPGTAAAEPRRDDAAVAAGAAVPQIEPPAEIATARVTVSPRDALREGILALQQAEDCFKAADEVSLATSTHELIEAAEARLAEREVAGE